MNTPIIQPQAFNVYRQFDSPTEAVKVCLEQPEPFQAFKAIVVANLEHSEPGFVKEFISEFESTGLI